MQSVINICIFKILLALNYGRIFLIGQNRLSDNVHLTAIRKEACFFRVVNFCFHKHTEFGLRNDSNYIHIFQNGRDSRCRFFMIRSISKYSTHHDTYYNFQICHTLNYSHRIFPGREN